MIQKEEYLKALEIVEEYHKQLNLQIVRSCGTDKTPVLEWAKKNRDRIKNRTVYNILTSNTKHGHLYKFEYIEDITEHNWKRAYLGSTNNWMLLQKYLGNPSYS